MPGPPSAIHLLCKFSFRSNCPFLCSSWFFRSTTSMAGGSASATAPWGLSPRTSFTPPTSSELQQVPRHSLIITIMDHYRGPNTQKRSPWCSSRVPLRYIQPLTCHLWHLVAERSTAKSHPNGGIGDARQWICVTKAWLQRQLSYLRKWFPNTVR